MAKKEKIEKNIEKKTDKKKDTKPNKENKKSLFVRFRIFCHGVVAEFKKIHWPSKYDLVKYSLAVIFFVIILATFFHLITVTFNLILKLFA
ncbi:MAG: preprotein translocase subunit SecE [Bacilli bacterium]|nr:preprotein translocase subunit SecE [Bacilli bacterium]MBQ6539037.1 preprotein translocase subunit SecE [Bacilli bacterium]